MTTLPKSLLNNPLLGTWIGFEETGRVRLATGKVGRASCRERVLYTV